MTIAENYNRIIARIIDDVDNGTTDQAEGTLLSRQKTIPMPISGSRKWTLSLKRFRYLWP